MRLNRITFTFLSSSLRLILNIICDAKRLEAENSDDVASNRTTDQSCSEARCARGTSKRRQLHRNFDLAALPGARHRDPRLKIIKERDMTKKAPKSQNMKKPTTKGEISFYRANEKPYGAFSNLFRCEVEFEGRIFPTAEHAYQAGKAAKPAVREWILLAPTPALAAMAAHGLYTWDIVPNWATIKVDRMRAVLRAKFSQHEELRQLLLGTRSCRLVEAGTTNNAVNRFWGEVNGKGENTLGKLLMELRDELHQEKKMLLNGHAAPKSAKQKQNAETEFAAV